MKQRYFLSFLAVAGVLGSTTAFADDGIGLDLGLRLGYGIPLGSVAKDDKLSDGISGEVPIWIDAGYRFTPNIMAGLYFQYAFAFVPSQSGGAGPGCPSGVDCSAHDMRLGIQGQYRIMPGEALDPWVGLGIGYEWLGLSESVGGVSGSTTFSGFEFLNLQGGVDFSVAPGLAAGPFVSFSLDQFSSVSCPAGVPAALCDGSIPNKALHEWLVLGVRGTFGI